MCLTFSLSYSLTSLSQKKGGTELALGTPKTPKNQLKTISYSVCKTDMFLYQMKDKDTSIDKLNCYAIRIVWVFLSFDNQAPSTTLKAFISTDFVRIVIHI